MIEESKPTGASITKRLNERAYKQVRGLLKTMEVADISEIIADLDIATCIVLFRFTPKERRPEVFSYLPFELQAKLLDNLPDLVCIALLNQMEPVDRTQLLYDLPFEIREKFILELNPEEMQITWRMLSYQQHSVGRLMSPEFFSIPSGMTVRDALAAIRWNGIRIPENLLNQIFVVDPQGQLCGHVNLSSLVLADPDSQLVDDLMLRNLVSLRDTDERTHAVNVFRKYDNPYIPVLNADGVMVGLVEAEDVFDTAEEEATSEIQAFGGQTSLHASYFQSSFVELLCKRGSWLLTIFIISMLSARVLHYFSTELEGLSFLLLFLPLILAAGGNAGSQAAALTLRGLLVREISSADSGRLLLREAGVGSLLGLMMGVLGWAQAFYLEGLSPLYAGVIGLSVLGVVIIGVLLGTLLPLVQRRFRLERGLASAPVISTLMDLIGLGVLFGIALACFRGLIPWGH